MNISAFMVTTPDRWWFQAIAIEVWLRQVERLPGDELVVVSEDDVATLSSDIEGARQVIVPLTETVSEKRSLGIVECRHPWVMMWDDDDWYGFDRLAQTRCHIVENPGADLVGYQAIHYHELITERRLSYHYQYGRDRDPATIEPYVLDGTMAFQRKVWERAPFAKKDLGFWVVDRLQEGTPYSVMPQGSYVAMIHGANTVAKTPRVHEGVVLSDSYMRIVNRAALGIPDDFMHRYEAAVWAQQGERE